MVRVLATEWKMCHSEFLKKKKYACKSILRRTIDTHEYVRRKTVEDILITSRLLFTNDMNIHCGTQAHALLTSSELRRCFHLDKFKRQDRRRRYNEILEAGSGDWTGTLMNGMAMGSVPWKSQCALVCWAGRRATYSHKIWIWGFV
jgi:hypothetical protein